MSQSVFRSQSRQRILSASIFQNEQGIHSMRLALPHGLDLTKGVSLAIDNGVPTQHTINTADANGSYARIPLNNDMIDAMKAGNSAVMGVSSIKGDNINIELSLSGFSSSFALLNR